MTGPGVERSLRSVTVRVPAKLNLQLSVGPRLPNGFHDVVTVYQALSLYDEITVAPARRLTVTVDGDRSADVPVGEDNLAARAARVLARSLRRPPGVSIAILKAIPVAGGMAGGSADAAAALLACDALWGAGLDRARLRALAGELGSDVPFALHGGCALGTGRGEILTPVLARGEYHWVLAVADEGVSTPAVYAELDRQRAVSGWAPGRPLQATAVLAALRSADPVALGRALTNDLQPAALRLRPGLRRVLAAGEDIGALGCVVSGSGPTVAMLARDAAHAVRLTASFAGTGVSASLRRATGPVVGARVLAEAGR